MAYFDEKRGEIVLSHEDIEMFDEIKSNFTQNGIKTPWADSVYNSIIGDLNDNQK